MVGLVKFVSVILCAFALIFFGVAAYQELSTKSVRGQIFDCATGEPVEGASIDLWQQTFFTGDRVHHFYATSTRDGLFSLSYNRGSSAWIHATKDGFLVAEAWSGPKAFPKVGLLERDRNDGALERSFACKRASECIVTEKTDIGSDVVETTRNACDNVF